MDTMMIDHVTRQDRAVRASRSMSRKATADSNEDYTRPPARNPDFPKSASYTYLPSAKSSIYGSTTTLPVTLHSSVSEEDLAAPSDSTDITPPDSSGYNTPSDETKASSDVSRDLESEIGKAPQITVLQPKKKARNNEPTLSIEQLEMPTPRARDTATLQARSQTSFTKRLSWRLSQTSSVSRSPSPPRQAPRVEPVPDKAVVTAQTTAIPQTRKKSLLKKRESTVPQTTTGTVDEAPARRGTILKRRSTISTKTPGSDQRIKSKPSLPLLPKSFSTERLTTVSEIRQEDALNPMPKLASPDRLQSFSTLSLPRKKDELWTVFRALDADYAKFSSKSTALKANVVRQSLLPFLRNYANHASNKVLRPEDLDRRTNILNKWWMGMLEILHGKNNQSLSGTDRPAILDAISGLMDRPEWRLYPSTFAPLVDRSRDSGFSRNKSTTSLSSTGADFLAESVHHNVRNLFVQNLSAQMGFVVEKMSLRHASASLVTFCGKATAFAFFYCPGIADVLVRLWGPTAENMRRVLSENGVGKFDKVEEAASFIVPAFPPSVQNLGFSSLSKMVRTLKQQPSLPLGTANMQWYGYWLERWLGRESDLFYVFVKHFHIIVSDYLPADATKTERMCAPGMLLVHSQILFNIDTTVHRDATPQSDAHGQFSPTFDDFLGEPDATISPLPLLPPNAIRIMAENRLIMLIRDFLSERAADHPNARHLFALCFNDLLHAAARKTSIFDHAACYTLCDFLEEAFLILVRYEHLDPSRGPVVDSTFWLAVWQKMLTSQNTLTEIRLYAFLYTVWSILCSNQKRKEHLCLGLLLAPDNFERSFNHWCPMVRSYYMRVLCWRLARYDGEATQLDIRILRTLFSLLRKEWSQYTYLRDDAIKRYTPPPSTAPSNPAPGRRLLIIRTDTQVAPGGSFLAFNGIIPPSPPSAVASPMLHSKRFSTISQYTESEARPLSSASTDRDTESDRVSGLRSFLRGMLGGSSKRRTSSRNTSLPASERGSPTPSPSPGLVRSATDDPNFPTSRKSSATISTPPAATQQQQQPKHRAFCFKFSLEIAAHHNKQQPSAQSSALMNMRIFPPRLPSPAQSFLQSIDPSIPVVKPKRPEDAESQARSKYVGRALAEWTLIVAENQGFFERRRTEGVPEDRFVETPTLGVEVFRKAG